MVMENKATSSSSISSSPKPEQKLKSIIVAVEEEEETMAANLTQGVPQEISSKRTISERASFGLGVVRTSRDMMKKHPTKNDLVYVCNICETGFASSHSLSGHHNCHKRERSLERQQKKIGESSNSHQTNPNNNSLAGENSQVVSSNVNHSWFSLCDFKPIGHWRNLVHDHDYVSTSCQCESIPFGDHKH